MRIVEVFRAGVFAFVAAGVVVGATASARAFDERNFEKDKSSPWAVFR